MKNKENKKTVERKQTPVPDGDTRPDKQAEGISAGHGKKEEKKLTKERAADVDTSEDYKDAL